jgi:hypothetical protein
MLGATNQLGPKEIAVGTALVQSTRSPAPAYGFADLEGSISGRDLLRRTMPCILPLFPKTALIVAGGFDESIRISEDYVLAARLHSLGWTFVQLPVPSCTVRDHEGERLTRGYGAAGYRSNLHAFATVLKVLEAPTYPERVAISQAVWTLARDASREGIKAEATALFQFASQLGGRSAVVGSRPVQLLYLLAPPYLVERVLEVGKTIIRRA